MQLLDGLEHATGLGPARLGLMVAFCAAAAVLATVLPTDRTKVRASVTLFILSLIGLLLAASLSGAHDKTNVYYFWTDNIALFLLSIAIVTLGGIIVFDIFLKALGARPAVIVCELILAFSYIAAALLLLSHVGVEVSGIVATSAVVTAAIGLSLQATLSNVMGGVAIQVDRSIAVGDWIRVNDAVGVVREIRWRQTSIETRNWDTVIIPNSALMTSNVVVLGRRGAPRQHRQYVYFNVDYRYPPTEVIAAVNEAVGAESLENVGAEPAPHCLLMDFKDSYASYAVRYWLNDLWADEKTDSLIRCRIVFALRRQGIAIAIPAYRTFQTEEDQERRQRIVAEDTDRRMAALSMVDLLAPLTDDERRGLAARLHNSPFARGESMARQGDESHCLYVITEGSAEVSLQVEGSSQRRVLATLGPGQFFGEMGLLTGDERSATVQALTDVKCLRLDKKDFHQVLHGRPEIAEAISQILAQRRLELDAAREHLTGEAVRERLKKTQGDLLMRIRKFFTLER